jgi:hypothetical protein
MSRNEMTKARRRFRRDGFVVTQTKRGHWRFQHPRMRGSVFAASTPSCPFAVKNLQADIKRKMKGSGK